MASHGPLEKSANEPTNVGFQDLKVIDPSKIIRFALPPSRLYVMIVYAEY
jgi:hypothetical protein